MNKLTLGPDTPPGFYWVTPDEMFTRWRVCEIRDGRVSYIGNEVDFALEPDGNELWGPIGPPSCCYDGCTEPPTERARVRFGSAGESEFGVCTKHRDQFANAVRPATSIGYTPRVPPGVEP